MDGPIGPVDSTAPLAPVVLPGVTIIVAAYKAKDHIGRCVSSLLDQDYQSSPIEILVGIDGCPDTELALRKLRWPPNVRVYMFPKNSGPYLVFNSLVELARPRHHLDPKPNLLFFGADDLAYPNMVSAAVKAQASKHDIVSLVSHDRLACRGAMLVTRSAWDRLGGYEPWRCAADWEMQIRAQRNYMTMVNTGVAVLARHISNATLSGNADTGMKSEMRKQYSKEGLASTKFRVEPQTAECQLLTGMLPEVSLRAPTLGVSMIVRDESSCLDKCLASVAGVDEIVVLDTGSKDNTMEIARKHTDKVFSYPWDDEYDAARNASMAYCTTDWILSIDADETLEPSGVEKIRKIIAEAPANHLALDVEMVSETKVPGQSGCVSRLVRLWRNHLGLQFTYVGHEVLNRIKDANANVKIIYGYSAAHRGDPDRMIRILQKGLVKQPDCPRYMFYLAREYACRKDYPKAVELYEKYLTLGRFAGEVAEAHLQVAKCYASLKDWKHAKEHTIGALCTNAEFREALLFASWLFGPKNGAAWKRYASTATNADVMFIRC